MNLSSNNLCKLGIGALLALACLRAEAQSAVRFPQGDATWEIQVQYPKPSVEPKKESPQIRPSVISVNRVGSLRRDRVTWTNGSQTETWWNLNPDFVMYEEPHIREIVAVPPCMEVDGMRLDQLTFRWITPKTLAGEENINGRPCLVYEGIAFQYEDGNSPVYRAWIDKETLEPVALDTRQATYHFQFSGRAPEPLALPPRFAEKLDQYRRILSPTPPLTGKRGQRQ